MGKAHGVLLTIALMVSTWAHGQEAIPTFAVDSTWPQIPENWTLGASAGVSADAQGNVWVIHRPATATEHKACCRAAPAILAFDPAGKLVQSWEGPGEGYQWPQEKNQHGIYVDQQNNVWVAGRGANGTTENQLLKFDSKGKFLLQIGRRGEGTGSNDPRNLGQPADVVVYAPTNEVFVADGYGNRRIIVFDATTGAYKRHWGAYGNRPDDAAPRTQINEGPGSPQFNQVHHVKISKDGLVYVADRLNRRIQIFNIDGTFVREVFIHRDTKETGGTVSSLAFSADPAQRFLYVADQIENVILILERQTMQEKGRLGRMGRYAGQFISPHNIATDALGNLYVAEDQGGQRVQKFVLQGAVGSPRGQ